MKKDTAIIYGEYNQNNWNTLRGLEDPLVVEYINRIKELDWTGYELWVYGGILEEWDTLDIDGTIMGEMNPTRINYLLDGVTRIGFELGIYPDIKWGDKLFDWQQYKVDGKEVMVDYAHYRSYKWIDNEFVKFAYPIPSGLHTRMRTWPMNKTLSKDHDYKSPILLNL